MMLASYISDLLYRYECVIVPNFGGFVTNKVSATIDNNTFIPPSKKISFNRHLQHNDGLLANYIVASKKISYQEALDFISDEITVWNTTLQTEELELSKIGFLKLNKEGILFFEPNTAVNYLTSSFGLSSFNSPVIKRITQQKQEVEETPIIPIHKTENNKKTPAFIKYAATAAIALALSTVGWNQYKNYQNNQQIAEVELQQKQVKQKIQEATFVISNLLPSITLNVSKQTYKYHIIAGAFREPANAEKKLKQLTKKGFNAKIIGVNKWNLTQVSYSSFNSKRKAINTLNKIKRTISSEAWLLSKEL